jgi:hypothetical protein
MAIWTIVWTFGIFYDHLVHFLFIWCIFSGFGVVHREKSGNPGLELHFFSARVSAGKTGFGLPKGSHEF